MRLTSLLRTLQDRPIALLLTGATGVFIAGRVLPDGETSELAARINDPVMFLGYWNQPEGQATNDRLSLSARQ